MNLIIWSGGQDGADLAALKTAKKFGLFTGGWMPKGCLTQSGPRPQYKDLYNLVEHHEGYKSRTWANVEGSDGTVRFASNFKSPGEICTLNAIKYYQKPYMDILVTPQRYQKLKSGVKWVPKLINFISEKEIQILNVAGNTVRTCQYIEHFVELYLSICFEKITQKKFEQSY